MPIGDDPLASYCFHVEVGNLVIAQFKSAEGLGISVSVIEHRASGLGGAQILKKLPGKISYDDIKLSRGKINDDVFWKWIESVRLGKIDDARKDGSILLVDYAQGQIQRFNFEGGWPSRVELAKLEAGADSVLLETCTITVEKLSIG